MSKQQTIGEILCAPPRIRTFKLAEEMQEKIRRFDEYEARECYSVCGHCPELGKYHKETELFWDEECGCFLCERCLSEEEEARDIAAEENRLHHRGKSCPQK